MAQNTHDGPFRILSVEENIKLTMPDSAKTASCCTTMFGGAYPGVSGKLPCIDTNLHCRYILHCTHTPTMNNVLETAPRQPEVFARLST
jgi:hypothetical protein